MSERQAEFTSFKRIHIAMGTWNVNGGKQFRSNLLGTAELADWLLDSPRLSGVAEPQGESSPFGKHKLPVPSAFSTANELFDAFSFPNAWKGDHRGGSLFPLHIYRFPVLGLLMRTFLS